MFNLLNITKQSLTIDNPRDPQDERHNRRIASLTRSEQLGMEAGWLEMFDGLTRYLEGYRRMDYNEDKNGIGLDGFAAGPVLDIAKALMQLLSQGTESNALQNYQLNHAVLELMRQNDFTEEDLR